MSSNSVNAKERERCEILQPLLRLNLLFIHGTQIFSSGFWVSSIWEWDMLSYVCVCVHVMSCTRLVCLHVCYRRHIRHYSTLTIWTRVRVEVSTVHTEVKHLKYFHRNEFIVITHNRTHHWLVEYVHTWWNPFLHRPMKHHTAFVKVFNEEDSGTVKQKFRHFILILMASLHAFLLKLNIVWYNQE